MAAEMTTVRTDSVWQRRTLITGPHGCLVYGDTTPVISYSYPRPQLWLLWRRVTEEKLQWRIVVFLVFLGAVASCQNQPLTTDVSQSPSVARTETSETSVPAPDLQKKQKKEGSERIFGIFPAFNVSNQTNPEPLPTSRSSCCLRVVRTTR